MSDTTHYSSTYATVAALGGGRGRAVRGRAWPRATRSDDEWHELTYEQVGTAIEEIALGLIELGIEPGDRVAILADTRLEWTLASYGISAAGGVVVPVYPTNSARECEWVLGDSGARAVFSENAQQRAKIDQVAGELADLRHAIGIEADGGGLTLDELRETRRRPRPRRARRPPGGGRTLRIRTRSSTRRGRRGRRRAWCSRTATRCRSARWCRSCSSSAPGERTYLYLPLAHVFALTAQLASYELGSMIIYYGRDTKRIIEELIETRPTYLPSVPRIFEKLYTAAIKLRDAGRRRSIASASRRRSSSASRFAAAAATASRCQTRWSARSQAADERLYSRVRALFGGEIIQAVSGAAPIAPEILEFFYSAGVPVLEGWGMTETSAVGTVGTLDHIKFGTVGRPMPGVEVKIADADQEILGVRGPNVFGEYWRNPEATEETMSDGWLRTGDLGEIEPDGFIKITGRKKDIIITAGGKNLTPANIENDLKQSRFISHAVMYGDRRPYPVALITLDPEEIIPWAQENGLSEDLAELAAEDVRSATWSNRSSTARTPTTRGSSRSRSSRSSTTTCRSSGESSRRR